MSYSTSSSAPAGVGDGARVLLVTPVHNEAGHIESVARGLAAQTRPPERWVVVDDNSTDRTPALLAALERELEFMTVVATPAGHTRATGDRLAAGAAYRALDWGLRSVPWSKFTHIGKLDADIILPPDYLERVLERFSEEPRLGVAGGVLTEPQGDGWKLLPTPLDHAIPNARIYSRECYEAIGGVPARPAADPIAATYARMRGYTTRSFPDLPVKHLRPMGTAQGALRGRARHGEHQYILHYGLGWALPRSIMVSARFKPYGVSGLAYLYGYLRAAAQRRPRVEDEEFQAFVRTEVRQRRAATLTRLRGLGRRSAPGA